MTALQVRKIMNEAISNRTVVDITYRKEEDRTIIVRRIEPYEIKTERRKRDHSRHVYIYAVDKIDPLKIKKFLAANFIVARTTEEKYEPKY